MFQRSRPALVASILLIALGSCTPSGTAGREVPAAATPEATWYVLESGRLVEVAAGALPTAGAEGLVPWTTAERIGGFARMGDSVYAAVNGYGVARIGTEQPGGTFESALAYLYDRSLFRGRTFQAMLPEADALLCHVYRDSLLTDGFSAAAADGPDLPNLVRMRPGADGYAADFLVPPFQTSASGWQVVSVARTAQGPAWLEWKRAAGDRTEFAYTTFDPVSRAEETVSREEFRRAHGSLSLEGFAPRPGRSLDLLLARLASSTAESDYLHVKVSGGAAVEHYVRVPAGGGTTRESAVFAAGGRAVALEPDGTVLAAVDGSPDVRAARLPPLPAGCVYSTLSVAGTTLIAAWEQIDFYRVGRAGLVVKAGLF